MRNLSLNAKFAFVLSIFVAASVAISILGVQKLATLNNSLDSLVNLYVNRLAWAKDMEIYSTEIRVNERNLILEDLESAKKRVDQIETIEKSLRDTIDRFAAVATEAGKKESAEMTNILNEWDGIHKEVRQLVFNGKRDEAIALAMGKSRAAMVAVGEIAKKFTARNQEYMDAAVKDAADLYAASRWLVILVSSLAILSGLTLAFFIMRSLSNAIDLVIQNLNDSSAQVTSAAQQIASSSEELSQAATEQASSLEETSSAVEEMNSMVKKNADTAQESTSVSGASGDSALKGKRVVEDMIRSMEDINTSNAAIMQQTNDSNQKIGEIVRVISEIGNKTKVINDIVFQTKLLSFNASVEAARAGEHGKGFAVVAEEVGNLAQMSGNAAKEITSMLDSSIKTVESIVQETKIGIERLISQSKEKVESGSRVARECGAVLEEIVRNVDQVAQMSKSISVACDEQSRGVNEITKAMAQLDQVTQQNAAASEQTASAAEELSAQAEAMRRVVESLILTVKGGGQREHHASLSPQRMTTQNLTAPNKPTARGHKAQVIALDSKKQGKSRLTAAGAVAPLRAVSGGDVIPSEDDPRFEEV